MLEIYLANFKLIPTFAHVLFRFLRSEEEDEKGIGCKSRTVPLL